jgi:hypothetical protein
MLSMNFAASHPFVSCAFFFSLLIAYLAPQRAKPLSNMAPSGRLLLDQIEIPEVNHRFNMAVRENID